MMKPQLLFIVCFLIVLFLPIFLFDTKTTVARIENRNLAVKPIFFPTVNITEYFTGVDAYVKDRFGLKQNLVELNNNINYKVLKKHGNDKVIIGKNKWLFYSYGDLFADFTKKNLVSDEVVNKFVQNVKSRADWCDKNGINFLFIIAPNKQSIYPEYYPIAQPQGITRTDQFVTELDKTNVTYLYPRNLLLQKKRGDVPLYFKTDTHWNAQSAYFVYREIEKKVRFFFPCIQFPEINFETEIKIIADSGDLTPMLGLKEYEETTVINFKPKNQNFSDYYSYVKFLKSDMSVILTEGNKKLPKALIFRDSFFTELEPFTSTLFSSVEYKWKTFEESDVESILQNKPDIIIWEIVERVSHGISYQPFGKY